jgi:hypothetical protein
MKILIDPATLNIPEIMETRMRQIILPLEEPTTDRITLRHMAAMQQDIFFKLQDLFPAWRGRETEKFASYIEVSYHEEAKVFYFTLHGVLVECLWNAILAESPMRAQSYRLIFADPTLEGEPAEC